MTKENYMKEAKTAEEYLRARYGAYRGHYAWREMEEAFNAGAAAEREACAVIAFNAKTYIEAAATIRARGQG